MNAFTPFSIEIESEEELACLRAFIANPVVLPKIETRYDPPPIGDRRFDWNARFEDYDLGSPMGHGPTEKAAIDDLLNQFEG